MVIVSSGNFEEIGESGGAGRKRVEEEVKGSGNGGAGKEHIRFLDITTQSSQVRRLRLSICKSMSAQYLISSVRQH